MKKFTLEEINSMMEKREMAAGDYSACLKFENEKNQINFPPRCQFGKNTVFKGRFHFDEACSFKEGATFLDRCTFGGACNFENCLFINVCWFGESSYFNNCKFFGERSEFGDSCTFCKCHFLKSAFFNRRECFYKDSNEGEFGKFFDVKVIDGFGSACRTTYFWIMADWSINVQCGFFRGSIDEWEDRVRETYEEGHSLRKAYLAAGQMVRAQTEFDSKVY